MAPLHPEVLWAQRSSDTNETKNVLFVTINLPDIIEPLLEYELTATKLSFKAKTGNAEKGIAEKDFAFDLEFFAEVIPEESSKHLTSRSFILQIRKKEKKLEYWPRLQKTKLKSNFIKTDFSKWVDEDEQDGARAADNNMDMDMDMDAMGGGMPGMGGMGGMPGMGGLPGMGGMGGMGDMDIQKLMAQMGNPGAGGSGAGAADESDSDDDGPPPLEEA